MTGRAFRESLARGPTALVALERHPLNVRLAVRGTVGLMVPLLLGQLLSWPALDLAVSARGLAGHLRARGARYDQLVAWEVERLAWQVGALRTAVGRIVTDGAVA